MIAVAGELVKAVAGYHPHGFVKAVDVAWWGENAVPFDTRSPFVTSGIRIGTPAATTRGFGMAEVRELAGWMCDVIDGRGDPDVIERVREQVLVRLLELEPGNLAARDLYEHLGTYSPGEALRIAKVYLLKWHAEGQLPYASLLRNSPHADAVVRACQDWLSEQFVDTRAIQRVIDYANIPERTLKRRFKTATGTTLIDYVQNLRIEAAKRLLENGHTAVDEISVQVGYEDPSFFRRLFKRRTGLAPAQYRRLFQPILKA